MACADKSHATREYFIGSLILIGDDAQGAAFQIIDGQQRLTTITILLSVLTRIGKELKDEAFASKCSDCIKGTFWARFLNATQHPRDTEKMKKRQKHGFCVFMQCLKSIGFCGKYFISLLNESASCYRTRSGKRALAARFPLALIRVSEPVRHLAARGEKRHRATP